MQDLCIFSDIVKGKLCIFLDAYNFVGLKTDKNDKIRKMFAEKVDF